jgi:ADP-ribose pyrophosphatase
MDKSKRISKKSSQAQCVFHGVRFDVEALSIQGEDGKIFRREFVVHPGAVVILPIVDDDRLVMIKNERFAVNKNLWELPAGTLEPAEAPKTTALRELIEETGYSAKSIELMTTFYTSPGISNELMYAYCASELDEVGQNLEETEKITVEILSWTDVLSMIKKGVICDGKTLAALLFYQAFYRS